MRLPRAAAGLVVFLEEAALSFLAVLLAAGLIFLSVDCPSAPRGGSLSPRKKLATECAVAVPQFWSGASPVLARKKSSTD